MWRFAVLCLLPFVSAWYKPPIGSRFQIQLAYGDDDNNQFDYQSMWSDMYEVDLWEVTKAQIDEIHAKSDHVICYFSAGTYDAGRQDASDFHDNDIGPSLPEWHKEQYLDIRSHSVWSIMALRMDLAQSKGCDGILVDNVDAWQAHNGFGLSGNDQLVYNKYLAEQAHSKNLCIGLNNDIDQIPQLHSSFDWALNEGCHKHDGACMKYQPFLDENKPVFNLEYVTSHHVSDWHLQSCTTNHPHGMRTQFKLQSLTAWTQRCPGQ